MNEDGKDKIYYGMSPEEFEKITGKKIKDLSDEEYESLERLGLFGKVANDAIVDKNNRVIHDYSKRDRYDMLPEGWWKTDKLKKAETEIQKQNLILLIHKGLSAVGNLGVGIGWKDMSEEEKRKLKIAQEVYKFAKKYYNSKGFKLRLQRHSDQLDETYRYSEYDPENAYTYFVEKTPLRLYHFDLSSTENNGEYDPITKTVLLGNKLEKHWYDPRTWGHNFVGGQLGMTAHEIGHAIDHSILLVGGGNYIMENLYSNTYPIFRLSKAYQKARRKLDYDEKSLKKFDLIPMWFYEGAHDAMPTESYADLFQLRELLYRLGIYDSTKENNKAEQKHLDELRKKDNRKYRIFDNFTDEQVLWMLNNVAQVLPQSKTSEQKVYYAKRGLKTKYYINKKSGSLI